MTPTAVSFVYNYIGLLNYVKLDNIYIYIIVNAFWDRAFMCYQRKYTVCVYWRERDAFNYYYSGLQFA